LLGSLISALGPTFVTVDGFGEPTTYLGGITNNPEAAGVPNTSYMFHFFSGVNSIFDNESAFTLGVGNGFGDNPATKGWFYFTPTTAVPESSTWAMMLIGFATLGFAAHRGRRNRLAAAFS
jgi:hypothetical protein